MKIHEVLENEKLPDRMSVSESKTEHLQSRTLEMVHTHIHTHTRTHACRTCARVKCLLNINNGCLGMVGRSNYLPLSLSVSYKVQDEYRLLVSYFHLYISLPSPGYWETDLHKSHWKAPLPTRFYLNIDDKEVLKSSRSLKKEEWS